MTKKESLLLVASVGVTLAISLLLLRWLAPGLLGISRDLQLVQINEAVPPFFENVFRREDYSSDEFLIQDPISKVRGKPLLMDNGAIGPHDILGLRNQRIPNHPDVITIGDSQTYGNNSTVAENWPGQLERLLADRRGTVYNMSLGGWAAPQYLKAASYATVFRPRVMIVAFYSGNDPVEGFGLVYSSDYWKFLRPDVALSSEDAPSANFPPPQEEQLPVIFADGVKTVFTPELRLVSNSTQPAIEAGYDIIAQSADLIGELCRNSGISLFFTIIPTKELVYGPKAKRDGIEMTKSYESLVREESKNIDATVGKFSSIKGASYVDLVTPLQQAALSEQRLYPEDTNGHPVDAGYKIIAEVIATHVERLLPKSGRGLVAIAHPGGTYQFGIVSDAGLWLVSDPELLEANGWPPDDQIPSLSREEAQRLVLLGTVSETDPERFGPGALAHFGRRK